MKISPNGEAFIQTEEGCRLTPYMDQAGKWTVGFGHLMADSEPKHETITLDRAKELFRLDLIPIQDAINHEVHCDLTQPQFDALCSLVFNIGYPRFHTSTLLRLLCCRAPVAQMEKWWKAWNKVTIARQLQTDPGLVARRAKEWILFTQGLYASPES